VRSLGRPLEVRTDVGGGSRSNKAAFNRSQGVSRRKSQVISEQEVDTKFQEWLEQEGIADPAVFGQVDTFDEVPSYSRLSQLEFISSLPIVEQNRMLISAALRHLARIHEHREASPERRAEVIVMVSVTNWWLYGDQIGECNDGTIENIVPRFWVGDLSHPDMKKFRVYQPQSRCAAFVTQIVGASGFEVFESKIEEWMDPCPARVYVALAGDVPESIRA